MLNLRKIMLKEMVHQIDTADQQIYTIGSPGLSIEIRFGKGDDEILISADDGSEKTRVWLDKENAEDLLEALQKAVDNMV